MAQRQRADISGHTYISITHSISQDQSILIFINYCSMSLCILLHSLGEGRHMPGMVCGVVNGLFWVGGMIDGRFVCL